MKSIGKIFLTGIFTVLPVLATVYLVIWLFNFVDHFLGKPLLWLIPDEAYRAGMSHSRGLPRKWSTKLNSQITR